MKLLHSVALICLSLMYSSFRVKCFLELRVGSNLSTNLYLDKSKRVWPQNAGSHRVLKLSSTAHIDKTISCPPTSSSDWIPWNSKALTSAHIRLHRPFHNPFHLNHFLLIA